MTTPNIAPEKISEQKNSMHDLLTAADTSPEMFIDCLDKTLRNPSPSQTPHFFRRLFSTVSATCHPKTSWGILKILLEKAPLFSDLVNNDFLNETFWLKCSEGNLDAVRFFLTSPLTKNYCSVESGSQSALRRAVQSNRLDVAEYLLKSPELTVHADLKYDDSSCIKYAGHQKNKDMALLLLSLYDEKDPEGLLALVHWDCYDVINQIFENLSFDQKKTIADALLEDERKITLPLQVKAFLDKTALEGNLAGVKDKKYQSFKKSKI